MAPAVIAGIGASAAVLAAAALAVYWGCLRSRGEKSGDSESSEMGESATFVTAPFTPSTQMNADFCESLVSNIWTETAPTATQPWLAPGALE
jgi:hypothetical protein